MAKIIIKQPQKKMREIINIYLPVFLIGLNFILYNALELNSCKNIVRIITMLFLIFSIIIENKRINRKKILISLVLLFAVIINGVTAVNLFVAFLFTLNHQTIDETVETYFKISCLLVIIMGVLLLTGEVTNITYISSMGRLRSTLGFTNPNAASMFYSSFIYLFVLYYNDKSIWYKVFAVLLSLGLYHYTNSRTNLVGNLIYIILMLVFSKKNNYTISKILIVMSDFLFIASIGLLFIMDKLMIFNNLLSYRISYYLNLINSNTLKEFLIGGTVIEVDNFYLTMLYTYGIIIYILMTYYFHKAFKVFRKNDRVDLMIYMICLLLVGLMESSIIRVEILCMLLMWKLCFDYENCEDTLRKGE